MREGNIFKKGDTIKDNINKRKYVILNEIAYQNSMHYETNKYSTSKILLTEKVYLEIKINKLNCEISYAGASIRFNPLLKLSLKRRLII